MNKDSTEVENFKKIYKNLPVESRIITLLLLLNIQGISIKVTIK